METTSVKLTDTFGRASALAFEMHREQWRKGSGVPYMGHILGVASIVIDAGGTEDEVVAALLHDGPEDAGGRETLERIGREFGDRVKLIVEALSDTFEVEKPEWQSRKDDYHRQLREMPDDGDGVLRSVMTVSIADKIHNLRAIEFDRLTVGESIWERFSAPEPKKENSLKNFLTLGEIYAVRLGKEDPLVRTYFETLDQLG